LSSMSSAVAMPEVAATATAAAAPITVRLAQALLHDLFVVISLAPCFVDPRRS
jgi:hypothetical protein